jgi:hypothetical protein
VLQVRKVLQVPQVHPLLLLLYKLVTRIAQSVAQSLLMQAVLKLLFVMVAQAFLELQEQPVQREQLVQPVLMAHLVQAVAVLETEHDLVLAHLVLVHVMMLSKLNSSTCLLADNSQ